MINAARPMYFKRLLILALICVVTLRDDFAISFGSTLFAATTESVDQPDADLPSEEDEAWDGEDDECDTSDTSYPDDEPLPVESSELPGMVESEVDLEAEELLFVGDRKLGAGSEVQFSLEAHRNHSSSVTFLPPLICLRI